MEASGVAGEEGSAATVAKGAEVSRGEEEEVEGGLVRDEGDSDSRVERGVAVTEAGGSWRVAGVIQHRIFRPEVDAEDVQTGSSAKTLLVL